MFIYNVTLKIQPSAQEEWLPFMLNEHIPEIMATLLFTDYRVSKLLEQDENDGITYVIQYYCNSLDNYFRYRDEFAAGIQKKHSEKFKDRFVAFRTLMEVVS